MDISFFGAAREVTGSCYLVETGTTRVLVDCGMFQGGSFAETRNFHPFDFDASLVDAVIVTHAHLDHTGRLPKLIKDGFAGKIFVTPPTADLTKLVLIDAWHIMKEDFKREYRPLLYEQKDVEGVMERFERIEESHYQTIGDLKFRFREAGHIFGSSFVEMTGPDGQRVTFSGDIGNDNVPILRPTAQMAETDLLIIESTYGNRIHEDESTREAKLREVVTKTIGRNGVLVIPAFAIERTQQLLYELHDLADKGLLPRCDVYLDSPMAIDASGIIKSYPEYFDAEAMRLASMGEDMFALPGLHLTYDRQESKTINDAPRPKIIIAGAGMMNGGRVRHHLVRYLGDPKSSVLIIGYQSEGTLGRKLYRGDKKVEVLGERIEVKAEIASIGAYSAHADQRKLVRWVKTAAKQPTRVYCTHGDEGAAIALATKIHEELGIAAEVPRYKDQITV